MKQKIKPLATPAVLFILSIIFLAEISSAKEPDVIGLLFPKVISILLLISSLGLAIKEFFKSKDDKNGGPAAEKVKLYLPLLVCFVAYIFSIIVFGFFISTPVFLFACAKIFRVSNVRSIILAAALTAVIYLLFVKLLSVPLPSGMWIFKALNNFIIY